MGGGEDARSARQLAGTPQTVTGQGALCFTCLFLLLRSSYAQVRTILCMCDVFVG